MAEMIPESLPSGRPKSERRVFDILQNLPDDYIVYHEPCIAQRYPDFVVICPDLGVMIIEVKGWAPNAIQRADSNQVILSMGGMPEAREHPLIQAKNYKFKLMNTFKDNPAIGPIRQSEGKYQGGFIFPFGHIAVLSAITSTQLEERGLTKVFPPSLVVTKDNLDSWEQMSSHALTSTFKQFFDPFWQFPRLDEKQVNLVRAVIHPEIVVRQVTVQDSTSSEIVTVLQVLDKKQEVLARKIGDGHRVLNGVAGSGKTVLLIHRAKWLTAEDPKRRILVLCYNKCLAAYLKTALQNSPNVRTSTFHQWGIGLGAKSNWNAGVFGQKVLQKVELIAEQDKYDAIFIDEAQDFDSTWLKSVVLALKDPEEGDLIVVADGNQGLYKPKDFKWVDVGIKARGRVIPLKRNYRNTEQIMYVAKQFAKDEPDTGEQIVPLAPHGSLRNGLTPLAVRAVNRPDEIEKIVGIVKGLINGRWNTVKIEPPLHLAEIGILYSHLSKSKMVRESIDLLKAKLKSEKIRAVWITDPNDNTAWSKINGPGVKIQTIHSVKGLQYRAVILMRADILPIPGQEETDERVMYVGLTRAEDYLAVTFTADSAFTKRIQTGCQEAALIYTFHCEHCDFCGRGPKSSLIFNGQNPTRIRIKCPKCQEKTLTLVP